MSFCYKLCLYTMLHSLLALPLLHSQSLIRDIYPGTSSAQINATITVGDRILMMADDGADGAELWVSDGTFIGTTQVMDIYAGSSPSYPANFAEMNGEVYFRADHPAYGFELWTTNPISGVTSMVRDVNPGSADGIYTSIDFAITESNNLLFLPMDDGNFGRELWVSDGSSSGTIRLLDSYVGSIAGINGPGDPQEITAFGPGILFSTFDYDANVGSGLGRELWRSNGTVGGTSMIMDMNPGGGSSNPRDFVVVGSIAIFSADDGSNGRELWRTNGTQAGTFMIRDINPGASGSDPTRGIQVGSELFFFADDGTNGAELWKTDGTNAGTVLVKDIYPGASDSEYVRELKGKVTNMISLNGQLIFVASDGTHGRDLWTSDGTEAGTVLLKDINPGISGSFANYFEVFGGLLYLYANDGTNGYELWATDGTSVGTQMIADINSGSGSSSPNKFTRIGDMMYFTADNGSTGHELFGLDLTTVQLTFPVEWLDFSAEMTSDQTVALHWQTAWEQQNHYFEVERGLPDGSFTAITRIAGGGNQANQQSYQAIDPHPQPGYNWYRLKQVDWDGTAHYSHLVAVYANPQDLINWDISPNPASGHTNLSLPAASTQRSLQISDMTGRTWATWAIVPEVTRHSIDLHQLPAGLYQATLIDGEMRQTMRLQVN